MDAKDANKVEIVGSSTMPSLTVAEYSKSVSLLLEQIGIDPKDKLRRELVLSGKNLIKTTDIVVEEISECCYYITDLHIDFTLKDILTTVDVKTEAGFSLVRKGVLEIVKQICDSAEDSDDTRSYLLVGGDVSSYGWLTVLFYEVLKEHWHTPHIIAVLGNHEYWFKDSGIPFTSSTECISYFTRELTRIGVHLLHNALFIVPQCGEPYVVNESGLRGVETEGFRSVLTHDEHTIITFAILGGTGFTGYSTDFNASKGIYGRAVSTIYKDKEHTLDFERVYNIVRRVFFRLNLVVLTHTPISACAEGAKQAGWVYINGHTHKNEVVLEEDARVYADNQIGYESNKYWLKRIYIKGRKRIFSGYDDGVYNITRRQYYDFYYDVNRHVKMTRDGQIIMVKKGNLYLFLYKAPDKDTLYILNGGAIKTLKNQDPNYYYRNIELYVERVNSLTQGYNEVLRKVSEFVRAFGGDGTIHGSIVDIDFFNHLYVNIYDGSVIPYMAFDTVDKYVYPSILDLLKHERASLIPNYLCVVEGVLGEMQAIDINQVSVIDRVVLRLCGISVVRGVLKGDSPDAVNKGVYVASTDMYKASRVLRGLQYIRDDGIIRIWEDKVLEDIADVKQIGAYGVPKISGYV